MIQKSISIKTKKICIYKYNKNEITNIKIRKTIGEQKYTNF